MDTKNPFWPQYDPDAMARYGGRWVVVAGGEIVADGDDPEELCERAAADLRVPVETVFAVAICRPEELRL